jgi:triosephosphate isomerase (TIM)
MNKMKPLIVANWKCNPTSLRKAKELFEQVVEGVKKEKNVQVVICPPFIYIPTFKQVAGKAVKIGCQDCHWEYHGAFTGEISASMAKDAGCEYIIIGHSERRRYFGETDDVVNKKLKAALEAGILPIFCIGETNEERRAGKTEAVLEGEINGGLEGINADDFSKITIAYEPIWAISDGDPYATKEMPTPENIKKAEVLIKDLVAENYGKKIVGAKIIYGGSVNAANSKSYLKEAGMSGLLVGGASLKAEEFVKIVKNV